MRSCIVTKSLFVGFFLMGAHPVPAASGAGIVSAATPEAAQAGVSILNAGGNAADAAVAVSFALAVTEPAMSGLGGQAQILLHKPGEPPVVLNGTSFSPIFVPKKVAAGDLRGRKASTVPAMVQTMGYLFKHYGSGEVNWAQVLVPAIMYAKQGFRIGTFRHLVWEKYKAQLQKDSLTKSIFLPNNGAPPRAGEFFRQPVLAKTLERLVKFGASDFYQGKIGREIAKDMEKNGGWIAHEDLLTISDPVKQPPLTHSYSGWMVHTLPPPGGGWVVLKILKYFEQFQIERFRPGSSRHLVRLAQALYLGHSERKTNPIQNLTDYDRDISKKLSGGETTHFSIVDKNGMAIAVTASINSFFGAKVVHPTLGFLYNNYMIEFETEKKNHPFSLRPKAMPYSSMSPTILSRKNEPVLALGSPGSARIISAVAQVIHYWADYGKRLEWAVAQNRVHALPDKTIHLENHDSKVQGKAISTLKKRGFSAIPPKSQMKVNGRNPFFGGVHAVGFDGFSWHGAADPRRDGAVIMVSGETP